MLCHKLASVLKIIDQLNDDHLLDEYQEHGYHDGCIGCAPHAYGALVGIIAVETACYPDGEPVDGGFQQQHPYIQKSDLVECGLEEGGKAGLLNVVHIQVSAHQSYETHVQGQDGHDGGGCQNAAGYQELKGIG